MKSLLTKWIGSAGTSQSFYSIFTEDQKKWIDYIDAATDDLIVDLDTFERNINDGATDPASIMDSIKASLDGFLEKAKELESNIQDAALLKKVRTAFHQKTNHLISKSYLLNRARTWPQGYQGDYKTLETVYRNMPMASGIGYYFDLIALNATLAEGVRNRIRMLQGFLKEELNNRINPKVMSIACGSCRELMELAPDIEQASAQLVCIDNDEDALQYAQGRLSYTGAISNIEFLKYNALRLFDVEIAERDFGTQDIIYSAGLFDYLDSDFLVKIFNSLYALLKKSGKIIAPFKDADKYGSQLYHWLGDWDGFQQRNEKDFHDIFSRAGIPADCITEIRDKTGSIIFYCIEIN